MAKTAGEAHADVRESFLCDAGELLADAKQSRMAVCGTNGLACHDKRVTGEVHQIECGWLHLLHECTSGEGRGGGGGVRGAAKTTYGSGGCR